MSATLSPAAVQELELAGLKAMAGEAHGLTLELRSVRLELERWKRYACDLDKAIEVIRTVYKVHNPEQSGHAMDIVEHVARSAANLPSPTEPLPF